MDEAALSERFSNDPGRVFIGDAAVPNFVANTAFVQVCFGFVQDEATERAFVYCMAPLFLGGSCFLQLPTSFVARQHVAFGNLDDDIAKVVPVATTSTKPFHTVSAHYKFVSCSAVSSVITAAAASSIVISVFASCRCRAFWRTRSRRDCCILVCSETVYSVMFVFFLSSPLSLFASAFWSLSTPATTTNPRVALRHSNCRLACQEAGYADREDCFTARVVDIERLTAAVQSFSEKVTVHRD